MVFYKIYLTLLSFATVINADLQLFEADNVECNKSAIDYNIVFKLGHQAGRFQKVKNITDMPSCIGRCCVIKDCDVAFMSRDNCYMVDCHSIESCVTKHLTRPKYETMLSFVARPRKVSKLFTASSDGEPAVEENLQETSPRMDDTFEFNISKNNRAQTVQQPAISRAKRSEAIDILIAVTASLVAIIAAVIVIFTVMRRIVDRGDRANYEVIK